MCFLLRFIFEVKFLTRQTERVLPIVILTASVLGLLFTKHSLPLNNIDFELQVHLCRFVSVVKCYNTTPPQLVECVDAEELWDRGGITYLEG